MVGLLPLNGRGAVKVGETVVWDDADNFCFGCSPHNERGLQLRCTRTGERSVELRFAAPPHLSGPRGVVHGGIQATLLDEALGMAARLACAADGDVRLMTAAFELRYRRPVPVGGTVVIRGELVRREGRNLYLEGRIESGEGELLTEASARWVRMPPEEA